MMNREYRSPWNLFLWIFLHSVLLLVCSLHTLTLATDADIYVVSEEETQEIVQRLQIECAENRTIDERDQRYSRESHCFADFDSVMCWPTTPANHTVQLACPAYVGGVSVAGKATRVCEIFDSPGGNASSVGQWLFGEPDYTECVEADRHAHLYVLTRIGHIGYATSVISLSIAIAIMLRFPRLRCIRNRVHINLFSAIILRGIGHFLQVVPWENKWLCKSVTVLNTYTIEATYSWVFVEALFLHNTVLVHVMNESSISLAVYASVGWVTPLLVTLVWVLLRMYVTQGPECWVLDVSAVSPSRLLLIIYPSIMILLNAAFFINILRVIFVKMQSQPTSEANRLRTLLRSTLVLVIIFGIYHIIFIPLDLMHSPTSTFQPKIMEFAQLYYRQVMEAFQGFLVSLLLCFLNKEVTSEFRRLYRRTRLRSLSIDPGHRIAPDAHDVKSRSQPIEFTLTPNLPGPAANGVPRIKRSPVNLWPCFRGIRRQNSFIPPVGPRRPSPLCRPDNRPV